MKPSFTIKERRACKEVAMPPSLSFWLNFHSRNYVVAKQVCSEKNGARL